MATGASSAALSADDAALLEEQEAAARSLRRQLVAQDVTFWADWYFAGEREDPSPPFHYDLMRLAATKEDPRWQGKQGLAVAIPRGHAKSTVVTKIVTSWWAVAKKKKLILILSDTNPQAANFSRELKALFEENERILEDFGVMSGDKFGLKWTEEQLEIVHTDGAGKIVWVTKIIAKSTGSKIRGMRARGNRPDAILLDDAENDEQVATPEQRRKTDEWFHKVIVPALDPRRGTLIIVGTILHFDSLLNRLLEQKRPDGSAVYVSIRLRAITADGTPLWPERFTLAYLLDLQISMGPYAFACEYMNEPIDDTTRRFRGEWVNFWRLSETQWSEDPQTGRPVCHWRGERLWFYVAVDPAIEAKERSDFFALVVIGYAKKSKRKLIFSVVEAQIDFPSQIGAVRDADDFFWPHGAVLDATTYQRVLARELARLHRLPIREVQCLGDKMARITSMAGDWYRGEIYLRAAEEDEPGFADETGLARVHENMRPLYTQAMQYPASAHDDLLDALEMGTRVCGQARSFFTDWRPEQPTAA